MSTTNMFWYLILLLVVSAYIAPLSIAGDWVEGELDPMAMAILESFVTSTDTETLLEAAQKHENLLVRTLSLELLGIRQEEKARALFLQLLKDEEAEVADEAAFALMQMGDAVVGLKHLEDRLRELEDGLVSPGKRGFYSKDIFQMKRTIIAARLAGLGEPKAFRYLVEMLSGEEKTDLSNSVKVYAVDILVGYLPNKEVCDRHNLSLLDIFSSMYADSDVEVRLEIVGYISLAIGRQLDKTEVIAFIESAAQNDSDSSVREKARKILEDRRRHEESYEKTVE